jgi:succinyl-CoA synthetase beta subunit
VANGIVAATSQFKVKVPIVIRLTGTNEVEAIRILERVGMRALSDMDQAVEQVVQLARGAA